MRIAVGLLEDVPAVSVTLEGEFRDRAGKAHSAGTYRFAEPIVLEPRDPDSATFVLEDFRIGIGFHWERVARCAFRGGLRVIPGATGFTAVNDVDLETYIASVIASEMSAESPDELLRAHAIVSRSWIVARLARGRGEGTFHSRRQDGPREWVLAAWYGHEGHTAFDVCADDHCQRYQGLPPGGTELAVERVLDTRGQFLVYGDAVCDARFYKCCGGVTDEFRTAWEDREVPYLRSLYDGPGDAPRVDDAWIRSGDCDAYCNTSDHALLARAFTGYDRETRDFYRWKVAYSRSELSDLVRERSGIDLGGLVGIEPLERGPSGRIVRLRLSGRRASLTVGKELEIRRVLSPSHLYSSAFVADQEGDRITLTGAGWGHGVGLCQVGAAVMAERGIPHREILRHYYPGAEVAVRELRNA